MIVCGFCMWQYEHLIIKNFVSKWSFVILFFLKAISFWLGGLNCLNWNMYMHTHVYIYAPCIYICFWGDASGKEPACHYERCKIGGFNPWVGKIPWRREWQPTLVFLLGKSHGQRRLVGYSPWGRRESDTNEVTEHTHTYKDTLFLK